MAPIFESAFEFPVGGVWIKEKNYMESLLTAHTFNTRPTKYGIGLLNGHNNSQ